MSFEVSQSLQLKKIIKYEKNWKKILAQLPKFGRVPASITTYHSPIPLNPSNFFDFDSNLNELLAVLKMMLNPIQ